MKMYTIFECEKCGKKSSNRTLVLGLPICGLIYLFTN